jgi:hypothetical protein
MSSMSRDVIIGIDPGRTSLCFDEDVTASKLGIGRRRDGKAEKTSNRRDIDASVNPTPDAGADAGAGAGAGAATAATLASVAGGAVAAPPAVVPAAAQPSSRPVEEDGDRVPKKIKVREA